MGMVELGESVARTNGFMLGCLIGGPDAHHFGHFHTRLAGLFGAFGDISFSSNANAFCLGLFVDGAAYAWPCKKGVHGVWLEKKLGDISAQIRITDEEWRGRSTDENKVLVAARLLEAFDAMAKRLRSEPGFFDEDGFRLCTRAIIGLFLHEPTNGAPTPGEHVIQAALREIVDSRKLASALGERVPEVGLRPGFRLTPDPADDERVIIVKDDRDTVA